jgi:hypothetical protein
MCPHRKANYVRSYRFLLVALIVGMYPIEICASRAAAPIEVVRRFVNFIFVVIRTRMEERRME